MVNHTSGTHPMAYIECINTKTDSRTYFAMTKPIISIGSKSGNDILLNKGDIGTHHARIVKRGNVFTIQLLDMKRPFFVNGRSFRSCPLKFDDKIDLSFYTLHLRDGAIPNDDTERQKDLKTLQELVAFSAALMEQTDPQALFEQLLEAIVGLTQAEKGFLIVLQNGDYTIAATHNIANTDPSQLGLSDTIIQKVVETKEPLVINNALKNANYASAQSVVDLKLSSVMCVPLIVRNELLGVIYLGNDSITGLFTEDDLRLLQVWAAQAAGILHTSLLLNELKTDNKALRKALEAQQPSGNIIGSSPPMVKLMKQIGKLAPTELSILILGETGTGKELVAKALHEQSSRNQGPFMSINCGAIPENLLESELFGHAKGAFTGAHADKIGKFEAANGGTIFLDEIGEMPMSLQVKLLRVLQERIIERVGEIGPRQLDIRIVSATNKNLESEITEGHFREDLFYRLNEVCFNLPPLRERGSDVYELAKFFMGKYAIQYGLDAKVFTKEAIDAMTSYHWAGNVRQLESRIKKALALSEDPQITAEDLGLQTVQIQTLQPLESAVDDFKMEYVRQALDVNNWNKTHTARVLEVDPRTIFRYAERLKDQ